MRHLMCALGVLAAVLLFLPIAQAAEQVSAQMCTREYRPVCGHKRGFLRTYPNACEARAAGARIVYRGRCRGN